MFHKISALGRISQPEVRVNQSGNTFLRFGLAVNKKVRGQEATHWHNCIVSGRLAETMAPMLQSGMTLFVEGEPSIRKDADGKEWHNVFVNTLRIASQPQQQNAGGQNAGGYGGQQPPVQQQQPQQQNAGGYGGQGSYGQQPQQPQQNAAGGGMDFDDDVPF